MVCGTPGRCTRFNFGPIAVLRSAQPVQLAQLKPPFAWVEPVEPVKPVELVELIQPLGQGGEGDPPTRVSGGPGRGPGWAWQSSAGQGLRRLLGSQDGAINAC